MMITFLVTATHTQTIGEYLGSWGRTLATRIRILPYEELPDRKTLGAGTYIFSDLERLNAGQLSLAAQLWQLLTQAGPSFRVLNNPRHALRRYELLRRLRQTEHNDFTVFRAFELAEVKRFPVFLRHEDRHLGPLGDLIRTGAELRQEIAKALLRGIDAHRLLVVEFCDVSEPPGVYRKASAFRIGDRVFPVHLYFNAHWSVKHADVVDVEKAALERTFLSGSRQVERHVRPIFDLARLDYGRIDYHVDAAGIVRVWEINTNPVILHAPETYALERLPAGRVASKRLERAFAAIDVGTSRARVKLSWDVDAALAVARQEV